MKTTYKDLQNKYYELDKEAGKYNRPEFDKVYLIIADLVKDRNDVGDRGNLHFPLCVGTVIDEALEKAGFSNDENFVSDFKKYREIEQQAREIQLQAFELPDHPIKKMMKTPKPYNQDGWNFINFSFFVPQQLKEAFDGIIMVDVINNTGLFANITDIPKEDESEDEYLMIDAFGLKCSFVPFLDELKQYKVIGEDGFLNCGLKNFLLVILKTEVTFIKENTDKPAKVKNHISETINKLDDLPVWGLFFQILTLQGLCRWFEGISINEGDEGYNEAKSLYIWLIKILIKKEIEFCYKPYGEEDKEILKPLCDYLYSTETGKRVQSRLFKVEQIDNYQSDLTETKLIHQEEIPGKVALPEIEPDEIFQTGAYDKLVLLENLLLDDKYIDNQKHWISKNKNGTCDIKSLQIFVQGLQQNGYFLPKKNSELRDFFQSRYNISIGQMFEKARLDRVINEYKVIFHDYNIESPTGLRTTNRIRS